MESKTKKSQIQEVLTELKRISFDHEEDFKQLVEQEILNCKVKFPLLEYFSQQAMLMIPDHRLSSFLDWVVDQDYEGGYVIAGKSLQLQLKGNMETCFKEAIRYFIQGDKWYCCDIISERVFGEGLLEDFEKAFDLLTDYTKHANPWVRRGIGVSIHYATKRKISKEKARQLLDLTLSQIYDKHIEVKKGFGWGLKTLTKFHPDMVMKVRSNIEANGVSRYYRTKMLTGLKLSEMNKTRHD